MSVSVPYRATLPLEKQRTAYISIGQNGMIPETYNLQIDCNVSRANPEPLISWFHNGEMIQGPQYRVLSNGSLVVQSLVRDRDGGVYTCAAYTPNVGRDSHSSSVTITGKLKQTHTCSIVHISLLGFSFVSVPPVINSSDVVNNPGNCLDLTESLYNSHRAGVDLCLKAGERARVTITCDVVDGTPNPTIKWFKDGRELNTVSGSRTVTSAIFGGSRGQWISRILTLELPTEAYGTAKEQVEGNYTCVAHNIAGATTASSYIALFGGM